MPGGFLAEPDIGAGDDDGFAGEVDIGVLTDNGELAVDEIAQGHGKIL